MSSLVSYHILIYVCVALTAEKPLTDFYSVAKVRLNCQKFQKGTNLSTGNITRFAVFVFSLSCKNMSYLNCYHGRNAFDYQIP